MDRYNQVPHLTQDTNGKVTNSQLDITNESQEVSPFPAGDHKATINRRARKHNKHKTEITWLFHKRSTNTSLKAQYCVLSVAVLKAKLNRFCIILNHAREPLYSKSAVIAWWSQSTSGKNGVIMYTLLLKNVINFLIFRFWEYSLLIIVSNIYSFVSA